jgi:signal transduction histidine kinase
MAHQLSRFKQLLAHAMPWMVLVILAGLTYSKFFLIPYAGFEFSQGKVFEVYAGQSGSNALQVGDRLIQVGPIRWEDFARDVRLTLFDGVAAGQEVKIIVERDGQEVSLDWTFPGPTRAQMLQRLNSQWWLAYVFWAAGTAAFLFIRPRDRRWSLLIALNYLTALWLAASSGPSHWHAGESAAILRAAIWLSVPVYLHFHWLFPAPLARLPSALWGLLYLAAFTLAALDWFQVLPATAYYSGFLLAFSGSILLLIGHLALQKGHRREVLLLGLGVGLMLAPPLLIGLLFMLGFEPSAFAQGGSMLALSALPGAYFFAAYRRQFSGQERRVRRLTYFSLSAIALGALLVMLFVVFDARFALQGSTLAIGLASTTLAGIIATTSFFPFLSLPALAASFPRPDRRPTYFELRANRLVSLYLFIILVGAGLTVLILISVLWFNFPDAPVLIGVLAAVSAVVLTAIGFAPFQRLVDRYLLNIPLPPTRLVETYAARITTSLESGALVRLLRDEILPSLLVRQSAVILPEGNPDRVLYASGVAEEQVPGMADLAPLLEAPQGGQDYPSLAQAVDSYPWIRLVLPLRVNEELLGVWLLGERDPDNLYTSADVSLLQTIASQTAIALANIMQTRQLHELYRVNIDRQENERISLARGLHDEVLNRLAAISMYTDDLDHSSHFQTQTQDISAYLRQVIADLRPAMLAYGLLPALKELAEELSERANGLTIAVDLPETGDRFDDAQVEQHLFRIVQQACENALRHARATRISITGRLTPEQCFLVVEDDGVGFSGGEDLDLAALLAQKHYGLAGMFERATLIGARLEVEASPGGGTRVRIEWSSAGGLPG